MTGEEGFLARWSRRKRAASRGAPEAAAPTAPEPGPPSPAATPAPPPSGDAPVEASPLPPVEAIDATSDIRGFLAPDVPAEVARAALRRAWSSDPAIRDFVGLSENSWDFTDPDAVPGFGALAAEEAKKLLAQAMGEPPAAPKPSEETTGAASAVAAQPPATIAADNVAPQHEEARQEAPKKAAES